MSLGPEEKPALPLDELNLTPQWVKAPAKSYTNHPGEGRPGRGAGRDFPPRPRNPNRPRSPEQRSTGPRSDRPPAGPPGPGSAPPRSREFGAKHPPGRRGPFRPPQRPSGPDPQPSAPAPAPVEVNFFPEEKGFAAMLAAMKQSPRAYALFDVAKLVLNKPERHVVKLASRPGPDGTRPSLYLVKPSESLCLSQEEAVRCVFRRHAATVYEEIKKPIDPPKGNFAYVNRCSITGVVLGPPNYHEYQARLVRHHQRRLAHLPFEQFKARIQTVKDPDVVQKWIESMSTATEYACRLCAAKVKPATPPPAVAAPETSTEAGPAVAAEPVAASDPVVQPVEGAIPAEPPVAGASPAEPPPAPAPAPESAPPVPPATPPAPVIFPNREELTKHFVEQHLSELITAAPEIRITGVASRQLEHGGLSEAVREAWVFERKFPLKTANSMRGRLRHEGFHFFKDRRSITYITRIKPRRVAHLEELAPPIQKIVTFVRQHKDRTRKHLLAALLPPPADVAAPAVAPAPAETPVTPTAPAPEAVAAPVPPATPRPPVTISAEDRLLSDLHWLIQDGYVVEFADGRLWVQEEPPPPTPPAPKLAPVPPAAPEQSTVAEPGSGAVPAPVAEPGATVPTAEPASAVPAEPAAAPTPAVPTVEPPPAESLPPFPPPASVP